MGPYLDRWAKNQVSGEDLVGQEVASKIFLTCQQNAAPQPKQLDLAHNNRTKIFVYIYCLVVELHLGGSASNRGRLLVTN